MELKLFEMTKAIDHYNLSYDRRPIDRRNRFNFQSLSVESLQKVTDALYLIEKAPLLFSEEVSVKEQVAIRRGLLIKAKCGQLQRVHEDMQKLIAVARDARVQGWYSGEKIKWSKDSAWNRILRTIPTKEKRTKLLVMKQKWQEQAWFSHYTSSALWYVLSEVYPVLEAYFEFATLEFKAHRFRLPRPLRREYKEYLSNATQIVQQMHNQLMGSMLARFEVMSLQNDPTNDDLICFIHEWMARNGYTTLGPLAACVRRGMTHKLFLQFHRYLEQHASNAQRQRMLHLAWGRHTALKIIPREEGWVVVPKLVAEQNLIPNEKRKFSRLSKQAKRRVQFFQDRFWLMTTVSQLESWSLSKVPAAKSLEVLADVKSELAIAYAAINVWNVTGWRKYLHYKSVRFVNIWKQFSTLVHSLLAKKYIELLEVTSIQQFTPLSAMQKRYGEKPLDNLLIESMVLSAEQAIEKVELNDELKERFLSAKRMLSRGNHRAPSINLERPSEASHQHLTELSPQEERVRDTSIREEIEPQMVEREEADGEIKSIMAELDQMVADNQAEEEAVDPPTEDEFTIDKAQAVIAQSLEEKWQAEKLKEENANKENKVDFNGSILIITQMDVMSLSSRNFNQLISNVETAKDQVQKLNHVQKQLVNKAADHLFKSYLRYCLHLQDELGFKAAHNKLNRLEDILQSDFAPKHIRDRIGSLRAIRGKQQNWWFMFYMQCAAYRRSCYSDESISSSCAKGMFQGLFNKGATPNYQCGLSAQPIKNPVSNNALLIRG